MYPTHQPLADSPNKNTLYTQLLLMTFNPKLPTLEEARRREDQVPIPIDQPQPTPTPAKYGKPMKGRKNKFSKTQFFCSIVSVCTLLGFGAYFILNPIIK